MAMPTIASLLAAAVLPLAVLGAWAQAPDVQGQAGPAASTQDAAPDAAQEWTTGVVTRWDARTGKVTIRHDEIRALSMPPMTMVFRLDDGAAQGAALQPGNAVRFQARDVGGALAITRIEPVR